MQIEAQELNPCTIQMTVTCSPEEVRAGYDKAFRQAVKQVRVPGFRPGAAPQAVAKKYVNEDRVRQIAVEMILNDVYPKAVKEKELKPIQRPMIQSIDFDAEQEKLAFTAKVPLETKVVLGDLDGLEAVQPAPDVSDDEVEAMLENVRQRNATREKVEDRGATIGDFAVVNILPDGAEGEGKTFMAVVGSTFGQLDQMLSGMEVEDSKLDDVTFPESFQEQEWAGKTVRCRVTLRSLSAPKLPELTDDYAKEFGAESLDELRSRVKEGLMAAKARQVEDYVNEQLLEALLNMSTVNVADNLWEGVAQQRLEQLVEERGKSLKEIGEAANMTEEQLIQSYRDDALLQVKRSALIGEIARQSDLKISNEDRQREILEFAADANLAPEEAVKGFRTNAGFRQHVDFLALYRKVMAMLRDKAKLKPAQQP